MKLAVNILAIAIGSTLVGQSALAQTIDNTGTLPNAKPGECYAKVITPTTYTTETQEVVVKEASEQIETIPAKFQLANENILVKEASKKLVPTKPVYGTVTEQVEIKPASQAWFSMTGKALNRQGLPTNSLLLDTVTNAGIDLAASAAGTCYQEYYKPAQYKQVAEKVLLSEASETIEVAAAEYQQVEERVLVKEASTKVINIDAVFETVEEQILIEPAKSVWKKGNGLIERVDNTTGEIMCLVEVPAKYATVSKKVLKTPATTQVVEVPAEYKTVTVRKMVKDAVESRIKIPEEYTEVTKQVLAQGPQFAWLTANAAAPEGAVATSQRICNVATPAEYQTVKRRVVKTPASFKVVEVPAEYNTVEVNKLLTPAEEKRTTIPAVVKAVSKQVKVADSKLEWKRVLCETNMTKDIVLNLQKTLAREGYEPGPADGSLGGATLRAIEAYQIKNNLNRGGLTYQTLEALKIKI